jgi:photosystem II stability/assembly factor-like uncharacterized protein
LSSVTLHRILFGLDSCCAYTAAINMNLLVALVLATSTLGPTWVIQSSGTTASLRGVSAAGPSVVWASGTNGTYLLTTDGGATWHAATVPGAESLDFRDVFAVDENTAYLLSIGEGQNSRVYKTTDGGAHWAIVLMDPDPKGFFDALAFWDARRGMVIGDPVDGEFALLTTEDGGETWQRQHAPPAIPNEGVFAASGTCLIVTGERDAYFVTGGVGAARAFHSTDGGKTWSVATTPIRNDSASAGIFSVAFADHGRGVVVGGDYSKAGDALHNVALTRDGGRTWIEPSGPRAKGFRSAVAYLADRRMWIATGPSGSDVSYDDGESWEPFDAGDFNALSFVSSQAGWAVGPKGRVARLSPRSAK